jgi:hypothetical protein
LRVLAMDLMTRLRHLSAEHVSLAEILSDLDATLGIARGPRLARQAQLGQAALRPGNRTQ